MIDKNGWHHLNTDPTDLPENNKQPVLVGFPVKGKWLVSTWLGYMFYDEPDKLRPFCWHEMIDLPEDE